MEPASIDEAKDALYGEPVSEFIAARDTMVKAVRAGGDRELANEIKALRKPSAVAAVVNEVVRADPDGVELILQAASLLRSAQAGALAGTAIDASELQQQYRAAIQALAQTASSRRVEVRAALEAATIDEASNEDLRNGSLVVVPTPVSVFGTAPGPDQPIDELANRRAQKAAKAAKKKSSGDGASAKEQNDQAPEPDAKAKAAADKQVAAEVERKRKRAEKEAAAEAERERKRAEKERQRKRKALEKQHRDAVRTHLAALDAKADADAALETTDQTLGSLSDEIEAMERKLDELRNAHVNLADEREALDRAHQQAEQDADEAQLVVEALTDALDALEVADD